MHDCETFIGLEKINACAANNKHPEETECGHARLETAVHYRL